MQILRFVTNLLLASLVSPAVFGLMAMCSLVARGVGMLSDLGVDVSVVQSERGGEKKFLRTAFSIQVMRGVLLWLACLLVAPFAAEFFSAEDEGAADLVWLIPLAGVGFVLAGFRSMAIVEQRRRIQLGAFAIFNVIAQCVGSATMVAWAVVEPSALALVAGGLASALAFTALTHFLRGERRTGFGWDRSCAREILRFGGWLLLSTALVFLGAQAGQMVLGRLAGLEAVGLYHLAMGIVLIPKEFVSKILEMAVFPAFSEAVRRRDGSLPRQVRRVRAAMYPLAGWALCMAAVGGTLLFGAVYPASYSGAGPICRVLPMLVWFGIQTSLLERLILAEGKPYLLVRINAAGVFAALVGAAFGWSAGGLVGAAAGVSVASALPLLAAAFLSRGLGGGFMILDLWPTFAFVVLLLVVSALEWIVFGLGGGVAGWAVFVVIASTLISLVWIPLVPRELKQRLPRPWGARVVSS